MKSTFIAGPCVIESAELLDIVAAKLVDINKTLGTDIIFKASFDKANRTSISSFRGPGIDHGLLMLSDIKSTSMNHGRLPLPGRCVMFCRFLHSCAVRPIC
jgi:2-dehydro-3-deoxyphosphooctonate aldolase (KDO 8-P synthase)